MEDTSSKGMVAFDEAGFDWSLMADEEVPTNIALMALSDSEVHNDKTCSNTCLKSFETFKTQYDTLRIEFNKFEFDLAGNTTTNISDATIYAFMANQPNGSQLAHEDLEQIHEDDLEEMDLKWQLALLSMRARRFYQKTGKKITINGRDTAGYDKSKVECCNCHKMRHFARECRSPRNQDSKPWNQDCSKRNVHVKETSSKAMVAIDGASFVWSFMADEEAPTNMAFSDSEVLNDKTCSNTCLKAYETLKTQYDNLRIEFNKSEFDLATYKRGLAFVEEQLVFYKKNEVMFCDQIVVLKRDITYKDSDIRSQITDKSRKGMGFESYNAVAPPPTGLFAPPTINLSNSGLEGFQQPEFEGYGFKANKSVCENLSNEIKKTYDALIIEDWVSDCDEDESEVMISDNVQHKTEQANQPRKVSKNPRNNRTNWNEKKTQELGVGRNFAPTAVLTKSGMVPISTTRQSSSRAATPVSAAKPINIDVPKTFVNIEKPRPNAFQKVTSAVGEQVIMSLKTVDHTFGDSQVALKDTGIFDSGCSGYMTGNKSYLTNYQDYDGGFMCDRKNSVIFTKTECLILSPDFKLHDENQVMLKIPRKDNMYSFDLKNIVPSKGLTCLFVKATNDESKLWHQRLGHINFKTLNKLVKGNLVRGFPSKIFENDHTCVACQKGKQHKASCKSKLVNTVSQPLQILHMDLFGPTFVKSIMGKMYCLVVIDDYSRFSWVFFLAKKDETSGILEDFITDIENQLNHKVKIIRCNNGTEFKNYEMNQFCGIKGIKREFSNVRTPQQNRVAERKNRTLIEAARTMVLVTKPHNKTPYELLIGRTPIISFMRPFGCPVTILNTLDHLGKFDGKADEGFLIGYSINNKSFRVFNSRTKKVEENLHVNFLENKPNVTRNGPEWLFDIDYLTNSMNYHPVSAGNRTNGYAGSEVNSNAGQAKKEKVSDQEYIFLPLMHTSLKVPSSSEEAEPNNDAGKKATKEPACDEGGKTDNHGRLDQKLKSGADHENINSTNSINIASPTINVAETLEDDYQVPNQENYGIFDDAYDDRDEG
ncbi:putative ribonuclease H-like domain-containing protein, partial [Tanacetum coccineum]